MQKLIKNFQIFHKYSNDFVKFEKFFKEFDGNFKNFPLADTFLYVFPNVLNSNKNISKFSKIIFTGLHVKLFKTF